METNHDLEGRLKSDYFKLKSAGERQIAETLDTYGIPYLYEATIRVDDNGRLRRLRPDFYLPNQDLVVEYFGRAGNRDYDERTRKKLTLYHRNAIDILAVYPWTLHDDWPNHLLHRVYFRPEEPPKCPTQGTYHGGNNSGMHRTSRPSARVGYSGPRRRLYR